MKLQSITLALIMTIQLDSSTTPPATERTITSASYQTPPATQSLYSRTSPSSYPMPSGISTQTVLIARMQNNQSRNIHFAGFEPIRGPQVCQSKTPNPCNSRPFLLENSRIW